MASTGTDRKCLRLRRTRRLAVPPPNGQARQRASRPPEPGERMLDRRGNWKGGVSWSLGKGARAWGACPRALRTLRDAHLRGRDRCAREADRKIKGRNAQSALRRFAHFVNP